MIITSHKPKTVKYLNYLQTRANLSKQELIKQDSFDYLANYWRKSLWWKLPDKEAQYAAIKATLHLLE